VLMDVQMPEMDGFEATAALREREKSTGQRLPVIAMTAYAMKGDRERCIEAGMDAYVSKPINRHELIEAIHSVLSKQTKEPRKAHQASNVLTQHSARPARHDPEIFNYSKALSQVDGDQDLLSEVAALFLQEYPKQLAAVREAIEQQDSRALKRAAHSLKGEASAFASQPVYEAATHIEASAEHKDFNAAKAAYVQLQEALDQLKPALEKASAQPKLP